MKARLPQTPPAQAWPCWWHPPPTLLAPQARSAGRAAAAVAIDFIHTRGPIGTGRGLALVDVCRRGAGRRVSEATVWAAGPKREEQPRPARPWGAPWGLSAGPEAASLSPSASGSQRPAQPGSAPGGVPPSQCWQDADRRTEAQTEAGHGCDHTAPRGPQTQMTPTAPRAGTPQTRPPGVGAPAPH